MAKRPTRSASLRWASLLDANLCPYTTSIVAALISLPYKRTIGYSQEKTKRIPVGYFEITSETISG